MGRVLLAVGCGLVLVVLAMGVAGFLLFRANAGGSAGTLTADPAIQALVGPRLPIVESLASSVAATCPAHATGNAPSPALGTPIVSWPETRGVEVQCMFESSPGNATGGGFEEYGDTSTPDGAWSEFGPSGWHVDACRSPGSADCTDYSYSQVDPGSVQIESWHRFAGGWAHVRVVMHR